jgi:hypothetical protein
MMKYIIDPIPRFECSGYGGHYRWSRQGGARERKEQATLIVANGKHPQGQRRKAVPDFSVSEGHLKSNRNFPCGHFSFRKIIHV